ncbi:MAG: Hsp33 protein [Rhodocyclaceae bacterium]|nr:Hsp33 protein [Rhodocyclaceae bacterium]
MTDSTFHRFLFENLDIRGAVVRLGDCWRQMQAGRGYAPPVAELLGEMAAVTALIAGQLKQPGRLTFQLRGDGPIQLLVMDCDEALQMRGMARADAEVAAAPAPELLGADRGSHLLLTLDFPQAREPYQSMVPLAGNSIADIFEHYLELSEQQASRLFLAAGPEVATCLFLQKMPDADQRDPDGWHRLTSLAETVKPEELLSLDAENLLRRLFHEDMEAHGLRLYEPRPVEYNCPENRGKVRDMILGLGRDEALAIVEEHGEIVVRDDICNREYRFGADEVAALFANLGRPH